MTAELPSQTDVVQAAGGLVVRRQGGLLQIVVVHRPVQQDWSFPKGKLEAGETLDVAALREVREETGMTCELLRFIGHTEYVDRKGRQKTVAYWIMAATGGLLQPQRGGRRAALAAPRRGRAGCSPIRGIRSWWRCSWRLTRSNPSSKRIDIFLIFCVYGPADRE